MGARAHDVERELLEEFGTATFSEVELGVDDKPLGWSGGYDDERDWKLEDFLLAAGPGDWRTSGRQKWANPIQLNQGREGACVGFAHCGVINAQPQPHELGNQTGFDIYHLAQNDFDPFPGNNYPGTTVRAGAMASKQMGFYWGFAMTQVVQTIVLQVLNKGPVTIGVDWMTGMDRVDSEGYIYPTGTRRGGHSVVIDGIIYRAEVYGRPITPDRVRIRNSWGLAWGLQGRCRMRIADLAVLLGRGGVACAPVEEGALKAA